MDTHEITKYLEIAQRRKYWIIIPFLAVLLAGLGFALIAPKVYEAQTLILVEPQRVPQDYVRSVISTDAEDRLRTITQQVTSRTNLERIIAEFKLQAVEKHPVPLDVMVEELRKRIRIEVSGATGRGARPVEPSAFTLSFKGKDPKTVMQVTNALASNFISENLKIRESQVLGTSSFLAEEVSSVEKRLKDKEEELKIYREKYMGGLPSQLDANIRMIEGFHAQLDRVNTSLRERESRRSTLQGELAAAGTVVAQAPGTPARTGEDSRDLPTAKSELAALEARYTPSHPDIIRLKVLIESLEKKERERPPETEQSSVPVTSANRRVIEELRSVESEIRNLRMESEKITSQIKTLQKMVEETPRREQELFALNRDYDNLKEMYNSLLSRKLEAEIAVSMERKQKGEQFRVIDPAKAPTIPVEPDMKKVILLTLVLGLGLGGGLGYLREMADTSYRNPEDIEKELKLPILVSVPFRRTEQEVKAWKRKEVLKAAGLAAGFAVSVVALVVGTKGFEATLEYIKELTGL